mmetsp:Transcript_28297/g.53563  ORF Transcript_28297/g.53563 Transcript_28297/m.53563 type:complete len:281 (+) Transcript_28297:468-1310(+)
MQKVHRLGCLLHLDVSLAKPVACRPLRSPVSARPGRLQSLRKVLHRRIVIPSRLLLLRILPVTPHQLLRGALHLSVYLVLARKLHVSLVKLNSVHGVAHQLVHAPKAVVRRHLPLVVSHELADFQALLVKIHPSLGVVDLVGLEVKGEIRVAVVNVGGVPFPSGLLSLGEIVANELHFLRRHINVLNYCVRGFNFVGLLRVGPVCQVEEINERLYIAARQNLLTRLPFRHGIRGAFGGSSSLHNRGRGGSSHGDSLWGLFVSPLETGALGGLARHCGDGA